MRLRPAIPRLNSFLKIGSRGAAIKARASAVDAVVNRQELAMPPAIPAEMAKGFTLYMIKAMLSGRGDQIVELARTNLRR
jgi:hypothetical protein